MAHPDLAERCSHFAAALLSGRVIEGTKKLQPVLSVKPAQFTTTAGRSLRRVSDVIMVLKGDGIDCGQKLFSRWQQDGVPTDHCVRLCVPHQPGAVHSFMSCMQGTF